jgi:hypothetical protein
MDSISYQSLRSSIQTGDLIACSALRFRDVRTLPDIGGWMSNRFIRSSQWRGNVDGDGFEDFIHVMLAVVFDGDVFGLEYTAGMQGLTPKRLSQRIANYPALMAHFPLTDEARLRSNPEGLLKYMRTHQHDRYSFGGLFWPELRIARLKGWQRPGRQFCSEGVVHGWQAMNVWPVEHTLWRRGFITDVVRPWQYSPVETIRACVVDRNNAKVVYVDE